MKPSILKNVNLQAAVKPLAGVCVLSALIMQVSCDDGAKKDSSPTAEEPAAQTPEAAPQEPVVAEPVVAEPEPPKPLPDGVLEKLKAEVCTSDTSAFAKFFDEMIEHYAAFKEGKETLNDFPYIVTMVRYNAGQLPVEAVEAFILGGASTETPGKNGYTAAHVMAEKANVEGLIAFKAMGGNMNARADGDRTPAHIAANAGNDEVLVELHKMGADLNAVDVRQDSVAHFAAASGKLKTLALLKQLGADIEVKNSVNKSPQEMAIGSRIAMTKAARDNDVETVRALHALGAKIPPSALKVAEQRKHTEMVELIKELGVDE